MFALGLNRSAKALGPTPQEAVRALSAVYILYSQFANCELCANLMDFGPRMWLYCSNWPPMGEPHVARQGPGAGAFVKSFGSFRVVGPLPIQPLVGFRPGFVPGARAGVAGISAARVVLRVRRAPRTARAAWRRAPAHCLSATPLAWNPPTCGRWQRARTGGPPSSRCIRARRSPRSGMPGCTDCWCWSMPCAWAGPASAAWRPDCSRKLQTARGSFGARVSPRHAA